MRTKPPRGISCERLGENFRRYVHRVTGEPSLLPFLWQGFVLSLLGPLPTIGVTYLRGLVYRLALGSLGKTCLIEQNMRFFGPRALLYGHAGITIGKDVQLPCGRHVFTDPQMPIRLQGGIEERVEIGDDVLLGPRPLF